MARSDRSWRLSFFLQPGKSRKPVLSEMSVSAVDGHAMSRLRLDAGALSASSSASSGRIQAESTVYADTTVYRLRVSRLYEERDYRSAAATTPCPILLPLGVVGADDLFLDLPQHALVSVCVVVSEAVGLLTSMAGHWI